MAVINRINCRSKIPCWIYLIRKFPDRLLSEPLLEEYQNTVEKKYLERSARVDKIPAKEDLDYKES